MAMGSPTLNTEAEKPDLTKTIQERFHCIDSGSRAIGCFG
jgi:hypothetical protein